MRVGMVGAGQLARMTQAAAIPLGVTLRVLAASADDPAAQVCPEVVLGGDLATFARGCDVVTFDHELVDLHAVGALPCAAPSADVLRLAADKAAGRRWLGGHGFPVPAWAEVGGAADVGAFAAEHGWPLVLKAVRGGYDGRGVWVVADGAAAGEVLGSGVALLAEAFVDLDSELAVLVARRTGGEAVAWPAVETVQVDGICHEVRLPAPVPPALAAEAEALALAVADAAGVVGLLAVELFRTGSGLLVNELATRPHNSGHWTIEGSATSQFANHLRAVLDLPLGPTTAVAPAAVMVNVLGPADGSDPRPRLGPALATGDVHVHLYGKAPRPGRKLGHVTAIGDDVEEVGDRARRAARVLAGGPA